MTSLTCQACRFPAKCLAENACLNERRERDAWANQAQPCSGSGFAHKAHGACPGYGTDRT